MDGHILSVQSHVSRDYVGNRGAALTLQFLGYDVDVVNTVFFSSMFVHEGGVLTADDFRKIIGGLKQASSKSRGDGIVGGKTADAEFKNHDIPVVCSGFTVDLDVLDQLKRLVEELKGLPCRSKFEDCALNSISTAGSVTEAIKLLVPRMKGECLWVLDPVIGDNNYKYVPEPVVLKYRELLESADVITPNEYELRWLADWEKDFTKLEEVYDVVKRVHDMGPSVVFVTSFRLHDEDSESWLHALLSVQQEDGSYQRKLFKFADQKCYVGGCGDVLSGLLTDRIIIFAQAAQTTTPTPDDDPWAIISMHVLGQLQAMVKRANENGWVSLNIPKLRHEILSAATRGREQDRVVLEVAQVNGIQFLSA